MHGQIRELMLHLTEEQEPLGSILGKLGSALDADVSVVLLTRDIEHTSRIIEEVGLSPEMHSGMRDFFASRAEAMREPGRLPLTNHGTVFVFSERESRARGCNSALAYYLARSGRFVAALVFCRREGAFDTPDLGMLDSVSSLLALLCENRFYAERVEATDGLVNQDGLTGLFNHRYFQEALYSELLKSQRFHHPVSLLLIDVDHFKNVNDRYGHPRGDAVLKDVSQILKNTIRAYDLAARYGGEEFGVVLPHADQTQALDVAERIRHAVMVHDFVGTQPGDTLKLTVSVGVATCPVNAKAKAELVDRADQALYLAKSEGRNRVCLSLANSSDPIRIGFCPAALNNSYYRTILDGLADVTREIKQIELSVRAPERESDYPALKSLFQKFAEDEVDAVAVCTQSPTALTDLEILHAADIPVFFFNVPEEIGDPRIRCYVGYDQSEAGAVAGNYLVRVLRGRGRIGVLEGLSEPTNRLRLAGFRRAVAARQEIEIVASTPADWLRDKAEAVATELFHAHPDLDAIFAVSDAMAMGAVDAARKLGKLGRVFIVGLDGTEDALQSIKQDELTATLHTDPREMGRILLRTMVRGLIREESVPRKIYSPINVVTKENVEHALNPTTRWRSLPPPPIL